MNSNQSVRAAVVHMLVIGMFTAASVSAQPATQQPLPAGNSATGMKTQTQRPAGNAPVSREAVKSEARAAARTPSATLPLGEPAGGLRSQGISQSTSQRSRADVRKEVMPATPASRSK